MRTLRDIDADIASLHRPPFPGMVGAVSPTAYAEFRAARDAWASRTPGIAARYEALLAERDAAELEHRRRGDADAHLERAGVPMLVRRALQAPIRKPAFDAADEWLGGDATWLVLSGSTGAGKSVAAGYALQRGLRTGRRATWLVASSLTRTVGSFDAEGALERVKHVDLLVVDDFGTEHQSSFADSVFFDVLHHRHEEARKTVLTTNLDPADLGRRLGGRLYDRIRHACVFAGVEGASLRGAA